MQMNKEKLIEEIREIVELVGFNQVVESGICKQSLLNVMKKNSVSRLQTIIRAKKAGIKAYEKFYSKHKKTIEKTFDKTLTV